MPIYATDILLKTAIEAGIADMRKNRYVLEDCLAGMVTDPISSPEFGWKEVAAAMRWFDASDIKVLQNFRIDSPIFPCISISPISTAEALESAVLADEGSDTTINPRRVTGVNFPIKNPLQVTNRFTPESYDPATGTVTMPCGFSTDVVSVGQYYVAPKSDMGYPITEIIDASTFTIEPGVQDDFTQGYVAPMSSMWHQHSGITFLNEEYQIGVHVTSDPVQAMWLSQILFYTLLRIKEALFEARGFELTTMSAGPIIREEGIKSDFIYSRNVTFRGKMPATFVKFVAPPFEKTECGILIDEAPASPSAYTEQAANQGWKPIGDQT